MNDRDHVRLLRAGIAESDHFEVVLDRGDDLYAVAMVDGRALKALEGRPVDVCRMLANGIGEALAELAKKPFPAQPDRQARYYLADRCGDLRHEAGTLRTERDELLRENAMLRRKLERLERKR